MTSIVENSPRGFLELIILEKIDDVLPLLTPEKQQFAEKMRNNLAALIEHQDRLYDTIIAEIDLNSPNPRKEMAIKVNQSGGWMAALMSRYSGKHQGGLMEYIKLHQLPDGSWPANFLDNVINEMNKNL